MTRASSAAVMRKWEAFHTGRPSRRRMACGVSCRMPNRSVAVSDTATARFGIRHETPQAILLRDGRPVWNASHFRITAAELARVLS